MRQLSRNHGFTLVELLVVIGIISILIGVLLPALSAARRQSTTIKCLSNLRQIGMAFQIYGRSFKGVWPMVYHHETPGGNQLGYFPPGHGDRSWMDFIAPFMTSQKVIFDSDDLAKTRASYENMKCPNYDRPTIGPGATTDPYYIWQPLPGGEPQIVIGYAMHYHPTWYEIYDANPLAPPQIRDISKQPTAVNSAPAWTRNGPRGHYHKETVWGRKGAQRGLIADSDASIIFTSYRFSRATFKYQPFLKPEEVSGANWDPMAHFTVNGIRHYKPVSVPTNPTLAQRAGRQYMRVRGTNMLFCDGHAETVTIEDAWNAIHNPGRNWVTD